tara:strand:- start:3410 stop:3622 length:213 start_codon:yes stop_codon:yes gene_type:complete
MEAGLPGNHAKTVAGQYIAPGAGSNRFLYGDVLAAGRDQANRAEANQEKQAGPQSSPPGDWPCRGFSAPA